MRWSIVKHFLLVLLISLLLSQPAFAVTIEPAISPTSLTEQLLSGTVEPEADGVSITVNSSTSIFKRTTPETAWSYTVTGLAEGDNLIRVVAVDAEGTPISSTEVTIVVDTVPPKTSLTAQPANPTNLKSGSFSFSSVDTTTSFECSMDGAAFAPCSSPKAFDFSSAEDSEHIFQVKGKDAAGNYDATPVQYSWIIDTTGPLAPTVTGTTPSSDSTPSWNWSPAGGGNGTYRYQLDDAGFGPETTQSSATHFTPNFALAEGSHILYVQERDAAGNWSESGSFAIMVDLSAPIATVSEAPGEYSRLTSAAMTVGGADVVAYRYKLDNTSFSANEIPVGTSLSLSSLQQGPHTVLVVGRDGAGNWQTEAKATIVQWTVDSIAPIVEAGGEKTANAEFTQTATASDAASLNYAWSKVIGPGAVRFSSPNALSTTVFADADGTYTLRFTATDSAGNSAYSEMALIWDTSQPETSITAHPENQSNKKIGSFSFTSPDASANFECSLDGAAFATCSSPKTYDFSSAADGPHSFQVRGKDSAGNLDATPAQFSWTIDTVAPGVPAVTGATQSNDQTPTWSWSSAGGGNGTFRYRLDNSDLSLGTETTQTTFDPSSALNEGNHTLYVQERDAAGNWSSSGSFTLLIDITAPNATVTGTPAQFTRETGATLTVAGAGVVAYKYKVDVNAFSGEISVTTGITLGALQEGEHAVSVIGRDGAGNWQAEGSATVARWTVDSMAPEVNAGSAKTANARFTQTGSATDATAMTYLWSKQSGPGSISFGSPGALSTTVSANTEGSYLLRLTATDAAGNSTYSETNLTWDVTKPSVEAGPDQTRNATFTQSASASDATALSYQWSKQSGPGEISFGNANAPSSTVTANIEGSYLLRITVTDAAGNSAYGEMTLVWDTTKPTVDAGPDQARKATFTQSATASDSSALSYQWSKQSGPGEISFGAATALSSTVSASVDGSYTLRLTATDAAGNSNFSEMNLIWDTVAPTVNSAASFVDSTHVDVSFSEGVIGADTAGNYLAANGLSITGATQMNSSTYRLTTSLQNVGTLYTITAKTSITDPAGNAVANGNATSFTRPPESNRAPSVPTQSAPANGSANQAEVTTLSPTLKVNASSDADSDPIAYSFEVSTSSDFSTLAASKSGVTATGGSASWTVNAPLADNTTYYWRTLANDGYTNSAYMTTATFFLNTSNDAPAGATVNAPATGTEVNSLTPSLSVSNANDADKDTMSYEFVVATDSGFSNQVAGATNIAAGDNGSTSWIVAPALNDNTWYFWRARGKDQHGSNGNWVSASFFSNTANDAPSAPTLVTPANGSYNLNEVTTFNPVLTINNSSDADHDILSYVFEIAAVNTFTGATKQSSPPVAEGVGSTNWTPAALTDNTTWYWRAKANDGATDGPWSATGSFFVNSSNSAPATPTVQDPINNRRVTSTVPQLELNDAVDVDHDPLTYEFAVFSDASLNPSAQVAGATDQEKGWRVDPPLVNLNTYYWTARAKDSHNYYSPWTQAQSFFVDDDGVNEPPEITLTSPGPSATFITVTSGASYTITWSASDPDSNPLITLYYDTNDNGYSGTRIVTGIHKTDPSSYAWDTSALPDGTYYIYAVIVDEDAAASTSVYSTYAGPILIDRTPPAAPLLGGSTPSNSTTPTWSWQSGGGGTGSYRYKLDSSNLGTGATESRATSFTPGAALTQAPHTLYVQEQDQVGNWSDTGYLTISVDTTTPYVTGATSNSTNGAYKAGSAIPITVTFSEPISSTGLIFSLNSGGSFSTDTLNLATSYSGTYIVRSGEETDTLIITSVTGSITDAAGNVSISPAIPSGKNINATKSIIIDTTVPLVSAGANKVTNSVFTQTASASDNHPLKYAWSKQAGPGEITFGTPNAVATAVSASQEGSYQLRFTATDSAGNASSGDMMLIWDTSAPKTVSATSTSSNGYYLAGSSVEVTVNFSEQVTSSGLTITLNSGATLSTGALTGASSCSVSYLVAPGQNTANLSITGIAGTLADAAGNSTKDPAIPAGRNLGDGTSIVVDTDAPDTALKETPANPSNAKSGQFSFSSPDAKALFDCSMDEEAYAPCSSPHLFNFSAFTDGSHSFTVRARDLAGNPDLSPAKFTWTIKTGAPTAILSGTPVSPTMVQSTILYVAGTDVVGYRYQLDAGAYSDETPVAAPIELSSLTEGAHTLRVIGRDSAGNWQAEANATAANWIVDVTPPLFQEISTLPDGSFTNSNELNIAGVVSDTGGGPTLRIDVSAGSTLFGEVIPVNEMGAYSYILSDKLVQGANLIRLTVTDSAGNQSVESRSINYDKNAPKITIENPADNSTSGKSAVEVTGSLDESVANVEVRVFDCQKSPVLRSSHLASLTGTTFSANPILAQGCNTLVLVATDLAGNWSSDKRSINFDDQKPTLAVTDPSADLRTSISIMSVKGTVADTLSAVTVKVISNSETFTPAVENGSFYQEVRFTQNAVYHILVKAIDAGGNETSVQRNIVYAKPSNGDINNDGRVDILDCLIALQISAGLLEQSDRDLLYGDVAPLVNGVPKSDGAIDVGDAVVILRLVSGQLTLQ